MSGTDASKAFRLCLDHRPKVIATQSALVLQVASIRVQITEGGQVHLASQFGRPISETDASKAFRLFLDHRPKVIATQSALLLQVASNRVQIIVAYRLTQL